MTKEERSKRAKAILDEAQVLFKFRDLLTVAEYNARLQDAIDRDLDSTHRWLMGINNASGIHAEELNQQKKGRKK